MAVIVAQLTVRSHMKQGDPGLNPVIDYFYRTLTYLLLTVCRKDENKENEAGNGNFFNSRWPIHC